MASAVRQSAELADLDSLIHVTQHLSDLLDFPESQPRLLWPPKLASTAFPQSTPLATKLTMPTFSNVNGSKLHTYSMKAAPYPLSFDQMVLDRFVAAVVHPPASVIDRRCNSDICDRITLKKLCKNGLTLLDFPDGPPDSVLDIGTGSGSWILEAASQWKVYTILVFLMLHLIIFDSRPPALSVWILLRFNPRCRTVRSPPPITGFNGFKAMRESKSRLVNLFGTDPNIPLKFRRVAIQRRNL
jgi:hypothetical protein